MVVVVVVKVSFHSFSMFRGSIECRSVEVLFMPQLLDVESGSGWVCFVLSTRVRTGCRLVECRVP